MKKRRERETHKGRSGGGKASSLLAVSDDGSGYAADVS